MTSSSLALSASASTPARGAGWDKASTKRHMDLIEAYPGKITQYARSNGLAIEHLVHLGGRRFVDDEVAWESLISLAWLRKHGADNPPPRTVLHITVEIETYVEEGDE
jgi:hypothetical protein